MVKDAKAEPNPIVLVYAGPNGSGKSTIADGHPIVGIYVNADDIRYYRGCTVLEAAQEAEMLRESLISTRKDFTFETVLSTKRNIVLLEKAKKSGYHIESVFVLTADVELNISRVKARVLQGGHDVPEDKIRSRYNKSLQMIKRLIELSDEFILVDNTDRPEVIYKKDTCGEVYLPNDFWNEAEIKKLVGSED